MAEKERGSTEQQQQRKRRRRFEPLLPPCSPLIDREASCAGCSCTFQQLDRLHSLVEQLLELRSKNARLFRRVRELERLKALRRLQESARSATTSGLLLPADEAELAFAESLLGSLLEQTTATPSQGFVAKQAAAAQERTGHLREDGCSPPSVQGLESRQAAKRHSIARAPCSPKVSKWTKVKAAFRWERAAAAVDQDRLPAPRPSSPGALSVASSTAVAVSTSSAASTGSSSASTDELRPAAPAPDCCSNRVNETRPVKTAWAMVKDMIQSRRERANHRGSIRSEDGYSLSSSLDSSAEQQQQQQHHLHHQQQQHPTPANGSEEPSSTSANGSNSKWNKVKRAFLSGGSGLSVPSTTDGETARSCSLRLSVEDLERSADSSGYPHVINDDKLGDWAAGTKKAGSSPRTATSSPKDKDSANALLMGEEQLTPEFKKKLQEWKRMKKSSPGTTSPEHQHQQQQLFRRRLTDWQIWRAPGKTDGKSAATSQQADSQDTGKALLSEEFLRKMDEWKKIKSSSSSASAASGRPNEEQSASQRGSYGCVADALPANSRRQGACLVDDREFVPLDAIISMIERRQKFIQQQQEKLLDKKAFRLNEIHRISDLTPDKREVLVRTSTGGFYRFQGISREFTRKLYEWEKSQGIAPEYSTFQLLDPAFIISSANRSDDANREKGSQTFKRSKSMSSVVESSLRDNNTLIRQPSSLSLNDVTNLENDACKLRIDSKQTIGEEELSEDQLRAGLDEDSEPEAVIVDIEDVIEETASPMAKFQPEQTPVYCVTSSETTSIAIPLGTVTASHEPSPVILIQAGETHHRIRRHRVSQIRDDDDDDDDDDESHRLSESAVENDESSDAPARILRISQVEEEVAAATNEESRKRLLEPSDVKVCETIVEVEEAASPAKRIEEESSLEGVAVPQATSSYGIGLGQRAKTENNVHLTVEAAEALVPSVAGKSHSSDKTESGESATATSASSCGNNEVVITVGSEIRLRKVLKTRRLTDSQVGYKWLQEESSSTREQQQQEQLEQQPTVISPFPETPSVERIIINENTLNKIVVPTASNERLAEAGKSPAGKAPLGNAAIAGKSDTASVFVKTKRIIFSPFSRRSKDLERELQEQEAPLRDEEPRGESITAAATTVPQSPILCRKDYGLGRSSPKEQAPSIRMMIQRYNQKLQEDGSPASSGSGSPIWRSPSSERRVRTQTERYQEELRRAIFPPQASSSSSPSSPAPAAPAVLQRRKSSLMLNKSPEIFSSIKQSLAQEFATLPMSPTSKQHQQRPADYSCAVFSSCSLEDLQACAGAAATAAAASSKSASAGMISVDSGTFERLRHQSKSSAADFTGTLSKIASKFRRTKLRRVKDKEREREAARMGTVSMLCRQSLLVDILPPAAAAAAADEMSKSCPTSPSPSQRDALDEHSRFKQHRDSS